jgi:signal transduction histidine kinase
MSALEVSRGEMLREVSHDLRGSLSMVAGASSLLSEEGIEAGDRDQVLGILQGGVRSVTQMLSDLMDMSRLEAGQEARHVDFMDAGQLLQELCEYCESLAQEKNLWLHVEGVESLPVCGDASKIRRIAQNLLLNALKYTGSGGVTVAWGELSPQQWFLSVSDTGPGLAGANAAPLAQEIAQATQEAAEIGALAPLSVEIETKSAPNTSRAPVGHLAAPGEGIGLSIVKRLCELLDATLELQTAPGQGSNFRVVLPRDYQG